MRKISELKKFAKRNKNKDVVGEYIFRQALLKFGIHFCIEQVLLEIETNKKYRACKVRLKELNNYKNRVSFASTTKNKLASVI